MDDDGIVTGAERPHVHVVHLAYAGKISHDGSNRRDRKVNRRCLEQDQGGIAKETESSEHEDEGDDEARHRVDGWRTASSNDDRRDECCQRSESIAQQVQSSAAKIQPVSPLARGIRSMQLLVMMLALTMVLVPMMRGISVTMSAMPVMIVAMVAMPVVAMPVMTVSVMTDDVVEEPRTDAVHRERPDRHEQHDGRSRRLALPAELRGGIFDDFDGGDQHQEGVENRSHGFGAA